MDDQQPIRRPDNERDVVINPDGTVSVRGYRRNPRGSGEEGFDRIPWNTPVNVHGPVRKLKR